MAAILVFRAAAKLAWRPGTMITADSCAQAVTAATNSALATAFGYLVLMIFSCEVVYQSSETADQVRMKGIFLQEIALVVGAVSQFLTARLTFPDCQAPA
jgi:hypothetical protein